jgi:glycosyltransferase involved in cell wall biosynthesis
VPSDFGRGVARTSFPRALQRPFTASLAHDDRIALLGALAEQSDVIVSLSDWQAEMLVRNGVPRAKLAVCRQGVTDDVIRRARPVRSPDAPLRVGYVGRYDDVKGVHVLVDAVMQLLMGPAGSLGPGPAEAARPESAQVPAGPGGRANRSGLELHLWGVARTPEARIYQDVIRRQCDGVPSITMHAESTADAIYQQIDVLAVPSLWFETGPLVVLEAHAAGVPVVGSNLGGIAERIRHGVDGLLVPPDDADALSSALRSLMVDRALLDRLRPNGPVRRMKDAADETHERYSQLLSPVSV